MTLIAQLMGVAIAIFGFVICAAPKMMEKILAFFLQGKNFYFAGVIRLATGLVLLLAAPRARLPLAAVMLGIVFLTGGIIVFAAGTEKLKAFLAQYAALPVIVLRLMGLLAACFGILMIAVL